MSRRVFKYELRRILGAKSFLLLIALVGGFSLFLIRTSVLRGVGGTAPFSPWSFGSYLLGLSPLFCAIVLFSVARLFGKEERMAGRLMSAAPFPTGRQLLIKTASVAVAWLLSVLLACLLCFAFYLYVFRFYANGSNLVCLLLILVPQLLFFTGAGLCLGRIHHATCYALIALIFVASLSGVPLPAFADPMGGSLLAGLAGTIPDKGVVPFAVPADYLISRALYAVAGIGLTALACSRASKPGAGRGE